MSQNSMRLSWSFEEVDEKLHDIMVNIFNNSYKEALEEGNEFDLLTGANLIRDAVVIAYCTNEAISIIENAGLMGVPIPTKLTKAIEALKSKEDDDNENC